MSWREHRQFTHLHLENAETDGQPSYVKGRNGNQGNRTLLVLKLLLTLGESKVVKASFQAEVLMTQSEDKSHLREP